MFAAASTDDSVVNNDDTIVITVTTAPAANAYVWLDRDGGVIVPTSASSVDDSLSTGNSTNYPSSATYLLSSTSDWFANVGDGDDTVISTFIGVAAQGTYGGTIEILDSAASPSATPIQTVTWGFNTAGAPTSMTVDPASLSLTASTATAAAGDVTVSLKDTSGNLTQMGASNGDAISVASASTTIASISDGSSLAAGNFDDSTATVLGTSTFTVQPTATAGSTTATATPVGTLPTGGVTAQSVAVTTTSGGTTAPTSLVLTSPTSNYIDDTNTDDTKGYQLNTTVTSITVSGAGASASASQAVTVATAGSWTGLTVAGNTITSSSQVILVNADASGNISLPASWTSAGTQLTISTGTGSNTKWVIIDPVAATSDNSVSPSGFIIQKTGEATTFSVVLGDDYGNPYPGLLVKGKAGAGSYGTAVTTNSAGEATISVPAPTSTYTGAAAVTWSITTSAGGSTSETLASTSITYNATGEITSMSVAVNGGAGTALTSPTAATVTKVAAANTPSTTGLLSGTTSTGYYTLPTSTTEGALTVGNGGNVALFVPTTVPANAVTITVPDGLYVSSTDPDGKLWNTGKSTATVASSANAYVWGTKTGSHDITISSGGQTITAQVVIYNSYVDSYNIALSPASQAVGAGSISTVELSVTDVWGNPVETDDDTGAVTVSASGEVVLAGFLTSKDFTTDENGKATVTIVAGNAGSGTLTAKKKTGDQAPAWATTYDYTDAEFPAAPVTSAAASVTVTSSSTKSITITGERGTVKGKPGVMVDGLTVGFEEGKTVVPYIKFPGQTSYSAGSSTPAIDADGEFYWQRKTGKKIYIYFTNDDGSVKSDRIIIPAK